VTKRKKRIPKPDSLPGKVRYRPPHGTKSERPLELIAISVSDVKPATSSKAPSGQVARTVNLSSSSFRIAAPASTSRMSSQPSPPLFPLAVRLVLRHVGCSSFNFACGFDFSGSLRFSWLAPGPLRA
jgi:hypothetical protein